DYEQRFPEDKRCEELGPLARVWRTYLEECGAFDIEMLEGWRDGLDVLLVFAGLFSAVVTTFVIQTSQNLQVNYVQVTATLLFELIDDAYMGLQQWGVGFIIGLLPILLSVSLGIFLVSLVLFLVPLQASIASIVGTITFVTFAIYITTNLLPVWYPLCPYKTLLSQYIFLCYALSSASSLWFH
ncbi:hypothetical protein EDD85DRAFT_775554, partial [Armillaria nabsnona]